jgi:hypothetical protein
MQGELAKMRSISGSRFLEIIQEKRYFIGAGNSAFSLFGKEIPEQAAEK